MRVYIFVEAQTGAVRTETWITRKRTDHREQDARVFRHCGEGVEEKESPRYADRFEREREKISTAITGSRLYDKTWFTTRLRSLPLTDETPFLFNSFFLVHTRRIERARGIRD